MKKLTKLKVKDENEVGLELKKGDAPYSFFLVSTVENGKIFEINAVGEVWWRKGGEFVRAKTDKELGKALGVALINIVEIHSKLSKDKNTQS